MSAPVVISLEQLPGRVRNVLAKRRITTLAELAEQHIERPCFAWGIGRRGEAQIKALLHEAGWPEDWVLTERRRRSGRFCQELLRKLKLDEDRESVRAGSVA